MNKITRQTSHSEQTQQITPEGMMKTPDGQFVPIPKRNRRGRKSRQKVSHPLRDLRLIRDMTLEELAEVSGLSPSYLSRLESGSRRLNVDTINRLSDALKCDPSDLLSSTEKWATRSSHEAEFVTNQTLSKSKNFHHSLSQSEAIRAASVNQQIPLFEIDEKTGKVDFGMPLCHIPAPAEIASVPGAFAYTVADHTMEPRFYRGDRLLVHPGKPLSPRATALVVTSDQRVIIGEFVAWRHQSELSSGLLAANDSGPVNPEDYILELKQYRNENPKNYGRRENDAPIGQIYIYQKEIISISRVIGMVEA